MSVEAMDEEDDDVVFLGEGEPEDALIDSERFGRRTHTQLQLGDKFAPATVELAECDQEWFNSNRAELLAEVETAAQRADAVAKLLAGAEAPKKELDGVASYGRVRVAYTVRPSDNPPYLLLTGGSSEGEYDKPDYAGFDMFLVVSPSIVRVQTPAAAAGSASSS